MRRTAATPAAYLGKVEGSQRAILDAIRATIRDVAPDIGETVEYGMLGYPGLANLGAQKHHVALYVMPEVLERHRANFPGVDCGKSCLRFRRLEQVRPGPLAALLRDVLETRRSV